MIPPSRRRPLTQFCDLCGRRCTADRWVAGAYFCARCWAAAIRQERDAATAAPDPAGCMVLPEQFRRDAI